LIKGQAIICMAKLHNFKYVVCPGRAGEEMDSNGMDWDWDWEGVTTNLYAYGCYGYVRSNFSSNYDPTFQFKVAQPRFS